MNSELPKNGGSSGSKTYQIRRGESGHFGFRAGIKIQKGQNDVKSFTK